MLSILNKLQRGLRTDRSGDEADREGGPPLHPLRDAHRRGHAEAPGRGLQVQDRQRGAGRRGRLR